MVRSTIQRMRFDHKAFGMIGPSDDFDPQVWHGTGDAALEDWPAVGAVREQLPQERELSEQGGQQQMPPSRS